MLLSVLGLSPKYGGSKFLRNFRKYLPTDMVLFQKTLILLQKTSVRHIHNEKLRIQFKQGHSATGRIMSLKNSNDTVGNWLILRFCEYFFLGSAAV
jgi:hypothetical protein